MPDTAIGHHVLNGHGVFHVVYRGSVGLRDVLAFFDRFEVDILRHPGLNEFIKITVVSEVSMASRDFDRLIELFLGIYARNSRQKKIALVAPAVPARSIADGFAERLLEAGGPDVARFDLRHKALGFLNVAADHRHQFTRH